MLIHLTQTASNGEIKLQVLSSDLNCGLEHSTGGKIMVLSNLPCKINVLVFFCSLVSHLQGLPVY